MSLAFFQIFCIVCALHFPGSSSPDPVHIRINQVGYLPHEHKTGLAFSNSTVHEKFELISEESGIAELTLKPRKSESEGWGTFIYYYELDFSSFKKPGVYYLEGKKSGTKSGPIHISGAY